MIVGLPGKVKNHWGPKAAEIKIVGPKGVAYVVVVQKQTIGSIDRDAKKPLGDAIVVPYWLARSVQDKNIANMRYSSLTCTLLMVAGGEEAPHRVSLPIMTNTKAVKGGDELVVFLLSRERHRSCLLKSWTNLPKKERSQTSSTLRNCDEGGWCSRYPCTSM